MGFTYSEIAAIRVAKILFASDELNVRKLRFDHLSGAVRGCIIYNNDLKGPMWRRIG